MVRAFRERDLSGTAYPYLYVDATYVKARNGHQVRSRAVIAIAMAVNADGRRELLGIEIGRGSGPGLLGGIPRIAQRARPQGREAGHLRRPRRDRLGGPEAAAGRGLAGLPHPLRTQHRPPGKARPAPAGAWRPTRRSTSSPTANGPNRPATPSLRPWSAWTRAWGITWTTGRWNSPRLPTSRPPTGARSGLPIPWSA